MKKIKYQRTFFLFLSFLVWKNPASCFASPNSGDLFVAGVFVHSEKGQFLFIQEFGEHRPKYKGYWSYDGAEGGIYWRRNSASPLHKLLIEKSTIGARSLDPDIGQQGSTYAILHAPKADSGTQRLVVAIKSAKVWKWFGSILPRRETIHQLDLTCPLESKRCLEQDRALETDIQKKIDGSTLAKQFQIAKSQVKRELSFVFEDSRTKKRYVVDRDTLRDEKGRYQARVWEVSTDYVQFLGEAQASDTTTDFLENSKTGLNFPLQKRGLTSEQKIILRDKWKEIERRFADAINEAYVFQVSSNGCGGLLTPQP